MLSVISLFLFSLYNAVHWRILSNHYDEMTESLRGAVLGVLNCLELYRVIALVALGFAVWAFRGKPRWVAWIALPLALLACGSALVIQ